MSFLRMSCASDFSKRGLLAALLYISCTLSSPRLSIVQTRVPSGLFSEVCVGFVGCCMSSYGFAGWKSRSGLIGVVENVRPSDLHPSIVIGFFEGVLLLTWRGVCVRCLYACNAAGLLSQSKIVESSCHAGPQCTASWRARPSVWSSGCVCLLVNPSFMQLSICSWVGISGLHWVTRYVV